MPATAEPAVITAVFFRNVEGADMHAEYCPWRAPTECHRWAGSTAQRNPRRITAAAVVGAAAARAPARGSAADRGSRQPSIPLAGGTPEFPAAGPPAVVAVPAGCHWKSGS